MSIRLDDISLPNGLLWVNEYDWTPVTQATRYSLTGALIIEEAAQQKGRPITLQGGNNYAWVSKATVEAVRAKVNQPDNDMTLDYHGTIYAVRFAHEQSPMEARPIVGFANPQSDDFYSLTIRLMEV